jgi:DNA-binding GntR family transcriptional regulator
VARFGVSSIPVREALLELENRGLVTRRHNRGCTVVKLTPREAASICELRRVLEPKVMEWAAARMNAVSAAALRRQLDRVEDAAASSDWARYFQEDLTFHRMLWEVAENAYASKALETAVGSLFASGLIGGRDTESIDLMAEAGKHRRLLDAICDADGQRAALCLLEIAAGFEKHLE